MNLRQSRLVASTVLAALALMATACSRTTTTVAPGPDLGPSASTPQGTVKRLQWAVATRNPQAIDELLSADFLFQGGIDSAGNAGGLQHRDDLLSMFQKLLAPGPEDPPVESVTLEVDGNLVPQRDPRPGHADSLHKTIRTSLGMTIVWGDGRTEEMTGVALFHLTRGDAASIPDHLRERGFGADRNRWWFTRWVDEAIASEGVVVEEPGR